MGGVGQYKSREQRAVDVSVAPRSPFCWVNVGYVMAQVERPKARREPRGQSTLWGNVRILFFVALCESNAVRAVALLGPHAKEHHVRPFELPGVNLFTGNELDPTDQPDAVLIFGGDGTIHRHLGGLALKRIPTLVVPIGSANDFAQSIGMDSYETAQAAWQRVLRGAATTSGQSIWGQSCRSNRTCPQTRFPTKPSSSGSRPWQGESLESMHFVPDGPRRDLPQMGARIMQSQLRRMTEAESEIARTTYFSCIAGTGPGRRGEPPRAEAVAVAARAWRIRAARCCRRWEAFARRTSRVSIERDGAWTTVIDEPGFLLAAGNGPQYGHGMRITHRAPAWTTVCSTCALSARCRSCAFCASFPSSIVVPISG